MEWNAPLEWAKQQQQPTNLRNTSTPTCSLRHVDRFALFIAVDIFVGYFIIFPCARRYFIGQNVSRQAINHFIWMSDRARAHTHANTENTERKSVKERVRETERDAIKLWIFIAFEMRPSKYDKWKNVQLHFCCQSIHNYYVINEMDYSICANNLCYPSFKNEHWRQLHGTAPN